MCELRKSRKVVVTGRGELPSDICLIGEAPWKDEDDLGQPFVGKAGHKLDEIIRDAFAREYPDLTYSLTNLVGCKPPGDDQGRPTKPDDKCIKACSPRLREFVEMADPKLIVCVGQLSELYTTPYYKNATKFHRSIPRVSIIHPAAILRMKTAHQYHHTNKTVIALRKAVVQYVVGVSKDQVWESEEIPF